MLNSMQGERIDLWCPETWYCVSGMFSLVCNQKVLCVKGCAWQEIDPPAGWRALTPEHTDLLLSEIEDRCNSLVKVEQRVPGASFCDMPSPGGLQFVAGEEITALGRVQFIEDTESSGQTWDRRTLTLGLPEGTSFRCVLSEGANRWQHLDGCTDKLLLVRDTRVVKGEGGHEMVPKFPWLVEVVPDSDVHLYLTSRYGAIGNGAGADEQFLEGSEAVFNPAATLCTGIITHTELPAMSTETATPSDTAMCRVALQLTSDYGDCTPGSLFQLRCSVAMMEDASVIPPVTDLFLDDRMVACTLEMQQEVSCYIYGDVICAIVFDKDGC